MTWRSNGAGGTPREGVVLDEDDLVGHGITGDGEQDVPLMGARDDEVDENGEDDAHNEIRRPNKEDPPRLEAQIDQLRQALSNVSIMYEDQVKALRKKLGSTIVNSQKKEKKIAYLRRQLQTRR